MKKKKKKSTNSVVYDTFDLSFRFFLFDGNELGLILQAASSTSRLGHGHVCGIIKWIKFNLVVDRYIRIDL